MSQFSDINPYAPGEVAIRKFPFGPIEFPGHQIRLSIVYNLDYLVTSFSRYRSKDDKQIPKHVSFILRWGSIVFLIGMMIVSCVIVDLRISWAPLIFLVLTLMTIFAGQIDNAVLRSRFRSVSGLNEQYSIVLSDEGYNSLASNQNGKFAWSSFTDAMEHHDGVLLLQGQLLYYWLPFSALENGTDAPILYRFIVSRLSEEKSPQTNDLVDDCLSKMIPSDIGEKQIKAFLVINEKHLIDSVNRHHARKRTWLTTAYKFMIALLFISAAILISAFTTYYWLSAVLLLFVVFQLFSKSLLNRLLARHVRSSIHYNQTTTITMSDGGFHSVSPLQDVRLGWDSFTEVAKFPDGVIIYQDKSLFNWIPYSSLEYEHDAAILYDFVSSRIAKKNLPSEG